MPNLVIGRQNCCVTPQGVSVTSRPSTDRNPLGTWRHAVSTAHSCSTDLPEKAAPPCGFKFALRMAQWQAGNEGVAKTRVMNVMDSPGLAASRPERTAVDALPPLLLLRLRSQVRERIRPRHDSRRASARWSTTGRWRSPRWSRCRATRPSSSASSACGRRPSTGTARGTSRRASRRNRSPRLFAPLRERLEALQAEVDALRARP